MQNLMKDKRSLLHFGVLLMVMFATTIFLTNKANEAIAEMDALITPIYLQR